MISSSDHLAKTYPIRRIDELRGNAFFIPKNGEAWGENEIIQLLNDLKHSIREYCRYDDADDIDPDELDEAEPYHLPPLVTRRYKCTEMLEVTEGQNHLVTVYLIIHYIDRIFECSFGDYLTHPPFTLKYATGNHPDEFLEKLKHPFSSDDLEWMKYIWPCHDDLNMLEIWKSIDNWFESQINMLFMPVDWMQFLLRETCFPWHETQ